MKLSVEENSAVIVLNQNQYGSSFQLFLPGELNYDEAPANAKMAVIICSLLIADDPDFTALILSKGKPYYEKYFKDVVVEKE